MLVVESKETGCKRLHQIGETRSCMMNRGDCEGAAMSTSALATCPDDFGRAGTIWINACGGSALQRSARWCAVEYNLVFGLGGQMGTALGWDGLRRQNA